MGIWFGFPLTFIICAICALLGITRVVPVWLAVTAIVVCVAVCWICCLLDILSDIKFDWCHLREAHKKRDQYEIANGRKWLAQNLLWLIFFAVGGNSLSGFKQRFLGARDYWDNAR